MKRPCAVISPELQPFTLMTDPAGARRIHDSNAAQTMIDSGNNAHATNNAKRGVQACAALACNSRTMIGIVALTMKASTPNMNGAATMIPTRPSAFGTTGCM